MLFRSELQSDLFESDFFELSYFFQYDVQYELENIESAVDEKIEMITADDDQFIYLGSK